MDTTISQQVTLSYNEVVPSDSSFMRAVSFFAKDLKHFLNIDEVIPKHAEKSSAFFKAKFSLGKLNNIYERGLPSVFEPIGSIVGLFAILYILGTLLVWLCCSRRFFDNIVADTYSIRFDEAENFKDHIASSKSKVYPGDKIPGGNPNDLQSPGITPNITPDVTQDGNQQTPRRQFTHRRSRSDTSDALNQPKGNTYISRLQEAFEKKLLNHLPFKMGKTDVADLLVNHHIVKC